MISWRDQILKDFTPEVARLTLVADPDGLLLEEGILAGIRERGFELLPFEDHVAFRYVYESNFRSRWDRGEQTDLVVVLRSQASDLDNLPYDLLQAGRKLNFNLGKIFPNLSYPVVTALDRSDLDALYDAQKRHAPGQLGDNATMEFVLRHVFEFAPELIKQPSDLLRVLLRRHYQGQRIPKSLDDRFIQILRQNDAFAEWPIEIIVPDREAFIAFIQERWPMFLDRIAFDDPSVKDKNNIYSLKYAGPKELPFDHHDIKVYVDTLFLEGILQPVSHEYSSNFVKSWASVGVSVDREGDRSRRLSKLITSLRSAIPSENDKYTEWFHFARGWAEVTMILLEGCDDKLMQVYKELQDQTDIAFHRWLSRRYAGIINLPPSPPVMLHHVPRYLAHQVAADKNFKVALLVVDGLSYDQWLVLREMIVSYTPDLLFRENAVFAWIPALTSVSRQAIFAGKPPIFFPNSIMTTEKEGALWSQFWADHGLLANEVAYVKGLGDGNLNAIEEMLSHPKLRVAGLVIDKIDRIMHGMELGAAGMHNQVRQWAQQPYFASLLNLVLNSGFRIFLTSDHGNIEAEGCGRPSEGAMAEMRGERARIYSDSMLRANVKKQFPSTIEWPSVGLPSDYLPLLAPHRKAFIREEDSCVCHGGIAIEEIIVPFVQIERKRP